MSSDPWRRLALLTPFLTLLLLETAYADVIPVGEVEGPLVYPNRCPFSDNTLASTCDFMPDMSGLPKQARTEFVEDWDTIGFDGETLAVHEWSSPSLAG